MNERKLQDLRNQMSIVRASDADSMDIWNWRNDFRARQMSATTNLIRFEEHDVWFNNRLKDINCYLYLGKIGIDKVGFCRLDIDPIKNTAEVSINLNPNFRNKKISSFFLQKVLRIFSHERSINLTARIKKENIASIKCFTNSNFIFDSEDHEYIYLKLEKFCSDTVQDKLKLIDEIENIRKANNVNWMDLLRLAFTHAPEETKLLIRKINSDDNKISALFSKLGE